MTQLRSVTCHMGSHSVTCYLTQVNTPHLNPSHTGWYSIYLPLRVGRLSWPRWLVTYRHRLPARRQSSIQVLTGPAQCRLTSWIRPTPLTYLGRYNKCLPFFTFNHYNTLPPMVWQKVQGKGRQGGREDRREVKGMEGRRWALNLVAPM